MVSHLATHFTLNASHTVAHSLNSMANGQGVEGKNVENIRLPQLFMRRPQTGKA